MHELPDNINAPQRYSAYLPFGLWGAFHLQDGGQGCFSIVKRQKESFIIRMLSFSRSFTATLLLPVTDRPVNE